MAALCQKCGQLPAMWVHFRFSKADVLERLELCHNCTWQRKMSSAYLQRDVCDCGYEAARDELRVFSCTAEADLLSRACRYTAFEVYTAFAVLESTDKGRERLVSALPSRLSVDVLPFVRRPIGNGIFLKKPDLANFFRFFVVADPVLAEYANMSLSCGFHSRSQYATKKAFLRALAQDLTQSGAMQLARMWDDFVILSFDTACLGQPSPADVLQRFAKIDPTRLRYPDVSQFGQAYRKLLSERSVELLLENPNCLSDIDPNPVILTFAWRVVREVAKNSSETTRVNSHATGRVALWREAADSHEPEKIATYDMNIGVQWHRAAEQKRLFLTA